MNAQRQAVAEYTAQLKNILRNLDELGVVAKVNVKMGTDECDDEMAAYLNPFHRHIDDLTVCLDPLTCHIDNFNNVVFEYYNG